VSLVDKLTEAKNTGNYAGMLELVPYSSFLGLTCGLENEELVTTMKFSPHLIGNPALPALHGGTTGALLESAAVFELLYRIETIVLPKTITITIDYLRSAAPVDTFARGSITRHGRRVANVRVEAWQSDRAQPIATANVICLVTAPRPISEPGPAATSS
jgi:acyl-coenzyme A thioesterase PaaI-like protein